MTTPSVAERLRGLAKERRAFGPIDNSPLYESLREAADTIERYEAALNDISKCNIVGYILRGTERHDDLKDLIQTLNRELQRRVNAAKIALSGGGQS